MKKYRLFANKVTEETNNIAYKERFSRITKNYILIYKVGNKPSGWMEITEENSKSLSASDKQWLRDANIVIINEEMQTREQQALENLQNKLNVLETELEAELAKEVSDRNGTESENGKQEERSIVSDI